MVKYNLPMCSTSTPALRADPPRKEEGETKRAKRNHLSALGEGGIEHFVFGELTRTELGDDGAVAKDVSAVAVAELLDLGGVPDEAASALGLLSDHVIDFELGADIDAAHWIVHENDIGLGRQSAGEQRLLLIATRER